MTGKQKIDDLNFTPPEAITDLAARVKDFVRSMELRVLAPA